jgi:hypothetical protein
MCAVVRKIISGNELIKPQIVTINTILPNDKYILLKGIVYSPLGEPLSGAALDIVQINSNVKPPIEKNIGVTFTLEDGSYGVPLLWGKGYSYKITAYSPG